MHVLVVLRDACPVVLSSPASTPHDIKGESVYAYVTLMEGAGPTDALKKELLELVKRQIGSFAAPDVIHWAPGRGGERGGRKV